MRHGLTQRCIDAGLPASPGGSEGFQHVGVHAHIQGRALDSGGGPAPASLDAGLLPIRGHGGGIVRVVGSIGSGVGNGRAFRMATGFSQ